MLKHHIFFIIACNLLSSQLSGQACCSGGTPLAGNIGLRPLQAKSIFIDLTYDYNTQRSLLTGSEVLDDDRRERNTNAILARASYAITDNFALSGIISWINEEERVKALNGGINRFAATGVGDAIAMVQYQPLTWQDKSWVMGFGVKFPLGSTNITDEETGLLLNPDLQPGSGSWDWIIGTQFQQQHFLKENLTLIASLTARFNSEADRFGGQQTYQFGREFRANLGVRDRLLIGKALIDPSLILLYRRTEMDQIQGIAVPNTGGNWIHVLPGLNWQINPVFSLGGSMEIPIHRNLTGTQLTTTNRFTLSIAYSFNGQESKNNLLPSKSNLRF